MFFASLDRLPRVSFLTTEPVITLDNSNGPWQKDITGSGSRRPSTCRYCEIWPSPRSSSTVWTAGTSINRFSCQAGRSSSGDTSEGRGFISLVGPSTAQSAAGSAADTSGFGGTSSWKGRETCSHSWATKLVTCLCLSKTNQGQFEATKTTWWRLRTSSKKLCMLQDGTTTLPLSLPANKAN